MRLDALLLALVAVAWLPANHYLPWLSAWQEGLALLAVALGLAFLSRRGSLPAPWGLLVLAGLSSVAVQWWAGRILFLGDAWVVAMYLLAFGLALVAGSTLIEGEPANKAVRLELLCLLLLAAALISAGIGFAQWAGVQRLGVFGADLPPNARPFANFGQPNHWCTASLIGIGAAWVLFEARRIGGFSFGLIAAVLLLAMVMSGSRTAWLQLGLGVFIVLWLRERAALRLRPLALAVVLALFALAWVLWPLLAAGAGEGAARTVADQARVGLRGPLWVAMLDAIALRPWAGYGWNQMVMAQQAVALDSAPVHVLFQHAHNLLLDLMIWVGVPLALVIIGVASWTLLRLLQATRDPRAAGLLLVVAGVLAHSMVEFAIEYAYFLLPMALMLGAAHRLAGTPSFSVPVGAARVGGAVLTGLLTLTAIDYQTADSSYRTLRIESARVGTFGVESPAPDLRVLTQLEALLAFARETPRSGASLDELAAHADVAARFPYVASLYRLAQWQGLNGDAAGAARTLRVLCAMHPVAHCGEVIENWRALQSRQPALQAVPAPPLPR